MDTLKLLTDEAVTSKESDGLGFSRYAEILGNAAIGTEGSFTIGVFGEWGTGKTSLMRLIQSHLDRQDAVPVVTVWFNAWQYEKEEHLIIPLIATMLKQLEDKKCMWEQLECNKDHWEQLKNGIGKLTHGLRSFIYGISLSGKVGVPGFGEADVSLVPKDMIDKFTEEGKDPFLEKSIYFRAFERLSSIKESVKPKIVVLIDDLDRCLPDSAIRLLENIKLAFSQEGFTFVIGVARKIIEGYLTHRYRKDYGISDFQGHSYLDKIVQLPFHLPSHRTQMDEYKDRITARLDETVRKDIDTIFPTVITASGSNPRAIIRFINNILIDAAIQRSLQGDSRGGSFPGEIPLSYFAITRCLQSEWNDMFGMLIHSEELCSEIAGLKREELHAAVAANMKTQDAGVVLEELKKNINFCDLIFSTEGQQWLKKAELRGATVKFLQKEREEPESNIGKQPIPVALIFTKRDATAAKKISEFLSQMNVTVIDVNTSIPENKDYKTSLMNKITYGESIVFRGKEKHPRWVTSMISDDLRYSVRSGSIILLMPGINSDAANFLRSKHGRSVFDLTMGIDDAAIEPMLELLKWKIETR